jgi:hypothetical protein
MLFPDEAGDVGAAIAPAHALKLSCRLHQVSRTGLQDQHAVAVTTGNGRTGLRAICQRPFSGSPSRAAKQAAESRRVRASQSIEPSRPNQRRAFAMPDDRVTLDASGRCCSLMECLLEQQATKTRLDLESPQRRLAVIACRTRRDRLSGREQTRIRIQQWRNQGERAAEQRLVCPARSDPCAMA